MTTTERSTQPYESPEHTAVVAAQLRREAEQLDGIAEHIATSEGPIAGDRFREGVVFGYQQVAELLRQHAVDVEQLSAAHERGWAEGLARAGVTE